MVDIDDTIVEVHGYHNVPARIASSARRLRLHLPTGWSWEQAWATLSAAVGFPAQAGT